MPLRVITAPGHSQVQSLGWLAVWWIETFTVHGPGDVQGEPVSYGDEYTGFIVDCYALSKTGRRLYDSAFFSRPKGCDKSGVAAALALFEAFGPARYAGVAKGGETYEFLGQVYTYAKGEPMGRVVKAPFIRIMATEEGQTGNVYDTIHHNLTSPTAPLFELQAYGLNPGLTKVMLSGGGEIRPSTAGSASKDGGLETFVVFDESHLYTTPVLRGMFRTVSRNLRKRKRIAETWYLETTTMYAPGEQSIAEETYAQADAVEENRIRRPRMYFNHRWANPASLNDPAQPSTPESREVHEHALREAFREAYGEAIGWNDVEALIDGVFDTRQSQSETRRYFFNALVAGANAWIQPEQLAARGIRALRLLAEKLGNAWDFIRPWDGDEVTLGFDGSLTNDATALVACRVRDRHLFALHIQEQPDGPEADGWSVDQDAVDAAVARAFVRFKVVGFYGDPPFWQDYVNAWAKEYGEQLVVKAGPKNEIAWWTKRDVEMALALELLHTAIATGTMTHDDDTRMGRVLTRHFINARIWLRRGGAVIGKEVKNSPKKIDAAVAAALAFKACADYLAGKQKKQGDPSRVPVRLR